MTLQVLALKIEKHKIKKVKKIKKTVKKIS